MQLVVARRKNKEKHMHASAAHTHTCCPMHKTMRQSHTHVCIRSAHTCIRKVAHNHDYKLHTHMLALGRLLRCSVSFAL
jgi:hypothetical protein